MPVKIAPITLVATKVIAKRIIERSTEPRIPASKTGIILHKHFLNPVLRSNIEDIRRIARYTIATPRTTHKNAGVTVITAINLSIAVTIPRIMLATTEYTKQLFLQQQFN